MQLPAQDDVRTRILAAATRLFAAQGVAGTSLQAVADAAGITKPTLVYHFGGKSGLRRAVLTAVVDHWREALPRLMAEAASGGPRLDSLLHAMFAWFMEDRDRARLVMRETIDAPDEIRAVLRERLQPWMRLLGEAIRAGQAAGTLRPEVDPEAYTIVVITAGIGILAAGDRTNALLHPEPPLQVQLTELVRVARTALLLPRPQEA